MIKAVRQHFNATFTEARYQAFVDDLNTSVKYPMDFHLCETPFFVPAPIMREIMAACDEIIAQVRTPAYLASVQGAIPAGQAVPNETPHTLFLQVDFALCRLEDGRIAPRLIELQGFPSLFGFQWLLAEKTPKYFDIPAHLAFYFGNHSTDSYVQYMYDAIVGDHDPQNVILMEIEPEKQKTRIDFAATEMLIKVPTVGLSDVIKRGRKLFYRHPETDKEIPIERIYNRVIFEDLIQQGIQSDFRLTDEVDVTWAGHPNWFFKISKYSLPLLSGQYVPASRFVSDLSAYPADLENYILKPLYSYSGMGVELDVTTAKLDSIPVAHRKDYILQRRIEYAPVIETPDEPAKVEMRIMFVWKDDAPNPEPLSTLVRMSKGRMMGTRHNKDRRWVGSGLAYYEPYA
jgi:hypothetical protein